MRSSKRDVVQPGAIAAKGIALLARLEAIALRKRRKFPEEIPGGNQRPGGYPLQLQKFQTLISRQLQQDYKQTMNIDPGIKVEKTKIINKLLEELSCFVEELEQQARKDLHGFKQGIEIIETDDTPSRDVKHSAGEIKD